MNRVFFLCDDTGKKSCSLFHSVNYPNYVYIYLDFFQKELNLFINWKENIYWIEIIDQSNHLFQVCSVLSEHFPALWGGGAGEEHRRCCLIVNETSWFSSFSVLMLTQSFCYIFLKLSWIVLNWHLINAQLDVAERLCSIHSTVWHRFCSKWSL